MRRLPSLLGGRAIGVVAFALFSLLLSVSAAIGVMVDALVPSIAVALLLACAGTWAMSSLVALRARSLARRVETAVGGASDVEGVFGGSQEWSELSAAIDKLVASLRTRSGQLAEERVRSQRLLEELPSAVVLFDGKEVVYANHAASRMFDVPDLTSEVTRSPLFDDPDARSLLDAAAETSATGRTIDVEIEWGSDVLAVRTATVGSGEVVLVIRDVTRARRLAAVRRDFVVNASHELKTPVAGIQALAESLELALRHNPERADRMVARMEQEAARLARLVRDLLDLARLEENEAGQDRSRIDLVEVIATQVDRLIASADELGVTIHTHLPSRSTIVAPPGDVRSIVSNLLENAVRYNRPGGEVAVRLRRAEGTVLLEVEDSGDGIAPEERERIFERFYRIDKARSRAAGGTGLGLSLVRHAVQRLGGTVTVDSELGKGSTFRVELPIAGD